MKSATFQAYIRSVLLSDTIDSNLRTLPDSCILLLDDGLSDLKEYSLSKRVLLRCLSGLIKEPLLWYEVKNFLLNRLVIVTPGFPTSNIRCVHDLNFYPRGAKGETECASLTDVCCSTIAPCLWSLNNLQSDSMGPLQDSMLTSPEPRRSSVLPFFVQSTPLVSSSSLKRRASSPLNNSVDLFE